MERKPNTGALFSNADNKKSDKHPDYTGSALVNGKMMSMAAWVNKAKSTGKQYMSLKFDDFKPKTDETRVYTTTAPNDAEIPF